MPEFDLDSMKKAWQEQPVQEKYNDNEILTMLNRNSRNYMKYIFWISVAEFTVFLAFGLYYIIQGNENNSFLNILEKLGIHKNPEIEYNLSVIYFIIKIISLVVTGFFVMKFYNNYKKIRVDEDLKNFITRILNFKKTVNAFIVTNIVLFVIFTLTLTLFVLYTVSSQNLKLDNATLTSSILGFALSTVLCVLLIWVYYKLVYGIIMSKLNRNLNQLKEIDSQ